MRILIYLPPNGRAVDQQSVMELFIKLGHEVFLLTHLQEGALHKAARTLGVKTFSSDVKASRGILTYLKQTRFLAKFIKRHKIEIVFAHLQAAGLAAGLARKLTTFRLFYIRHNTDEHKLQANRNAIVINWLTNKVTSTIIAPSDKVYNYITQEEGISPSRVVRLNYGYNFDQYLQTDREGHAGAIREQFNCQMLIISVARLIPAKRHLLMFDVVKQVRETGRDVKMICLSEGNLKLVLEQYIADNKLKETIFLLGNKTAVLDYLEASTVFFHLSETEASNSAVKEAGLCKIPVIVCSDVGDFDDYIIDEVNGFLTSKKDPVPRSVEIITKLYDQPGLASAIGSKFHETILREFSIENVARQYEELLLN